VENRSFKQKPKLSSSILPAHFTDASPGQVGSPKISGLLEQSLYGLHVLPVVQPTRQITEGKFNYSKYKMITTECSFITVWYASALVSETQHKRQ